MYGKNGNQQYQSITSFQAGSLPPSQQVENNTDYGYLTPVHCDGIRSIIEALPVEKWKKEILNECNLLPSIKESTGAAETDSVDPFVSYLDRNRIDNEHPLRPDAALRIIQDRIGDIKDNGELNGVINSVLDYQQNLERCLKNYQNSAPFIKNILIGLSNQTAQIVQTALSGDVTRQSSDGGGRALQARLRKTFESQCENHGNVDEEQPDKSQREINGLQNFSDRKIIGVYNQIQSVKANIEDFKEIQYSAAKLINLNKQVNDPQIGRKSAEINKSFNDCKKQLSDLNISIDDVHDVDRLKEIVKKYKEHQTQMEHSLKVLEKEHDALVIKDIDERIRQHVKNFENIKFAISHANACLEETQRLTELGGDDRYSSVRNRAEELKKKNRLPNEADKKFLLQYETATHSLQNSLYHIKESGFLSNELINKNDVERFLKNANEKLKDLDKELQRLQDLKRNKLKMSMPESQYRK